MLEIRNQKLATRRLPLATVLLLSAFSLQPSAFASDPSGGKVRHIIIYALQTGTPSELGYPMAIAGFAGNTNCKFSSGQSLPCGHHVDSTTNEFVHTFNAMRAAIDSGNMDRFSDQQSISTTQPADAVSQLNLQNNLPNLYLVATTFATFDNWWAIGANSFPGMYTLMTGSPKWDANDAYSDTPPTSLNHYGCVNSGVTAGTINLTTGAQSTETDCLSTGGSNYPQTIFQNADTAGVSWKEYWTNDGNSDGVWNIAAHSMTICNADAGDGNACTAAEYTNHVALLTQFDTDLTNGTLPQFSLYIPQIQNSFRPAASLCAAENALSTELTNLFASSSWPSTVLIITFTNPAGYSDSVAPPVNGVNLYGLRDPAIVVSPFAIGGSVSHTFHTLAAALVFAEEVFGIASMNQLDQASISGDLTEALNFTLNTSPPTLNQRTCASPVAAWSSTAAEYQNFAGTTGVGATTTGTAATFTNNSVSLTGVSVTTYGDAAQTNNCPATMSGTPSTCTVTPKFAPKAAGTRFGWVVVNCTGSIGCPVTMLLQGTGVGGVTMRGITARGVATQ